MEIASSTSGCSIIYKLYDVILGELPEDIDFEKLTVLTIPYSARYVSCDITTLNIASEPINWDVQAS